MARRSSRGKSGGGFSRAHPDSKPSKSTTPSPIHAQSSAPVKSEPTTGGVGAAIVEGLGWGVGTTIGNRVTDAIMGPRVIRHETVESAAQPVPNKATQDACVEHYKAFEECLNTSGNDISRCQFYMDMLTQCRKISPSTPASVAGF